MGRTKKDVLTDDLLKKSHAHKPKVAEPKVCPYCNGSGMVGDKECPKCYGEGIIFGD